MNGSVNTVYKAERNMYKAIVDYLEHFEDELVDGLTVERVANAAIAVVTGEAALPKGF